MLTREQILEIDSYCAEHRIRQIDRLAELDIPRHQFYRWKRKYRDEDEREQGAEAGAFLQLPSTGAFMSPMMPPAHTSGKSRSKAGAPQPQEQSFLTVELRTASGSAMRIQGCMTAAHLRELIAASNV